MDGMTSNSALKRRGSPPCKCTSETSGDPTTLRFSSSKRCCRYLGIRFSSTRWRISLSNCFRISAAGTFPGRKPGSLAFFWTSIRTRSVSASTSEVGTVISSECLQPSSSAKGEYLGEATSKSKFHSTRTGAVRHVTTKAMLRRTFLAGGGAAAGAAALPAAAPAKGIPLGFDSYSIGRLRWKAIELLDYTAGLKLDTIQLSSLGDYESLEPPYLQKVKDHAARLGIQIDAGTGCICPSSSSYGKTQGDAREYLLKSLRVARAVGSKSMRCFMGSSADRRGRLHIEAHMENTVKLFRAVRAEALDLGIKIALENHSGDMQAREVRTIIEEAGKDFVGACLDTGNPIWVCENPMVTLEILAPYVVTTHIRDSAVFEHPRGAAAQWVALGEGSGDCRRFMVLDRELCPTLPAMQLEIITGRKPQVLPYLEPDFWKVYPKMPAWEFARFVALAKSGRPFMDDMLMVAGASQPPAILEALKLQQKVDLERSLEYAKKTLGLGLR